MEELEVLGYIKNFKTSYVNFYEERATAGTILTEFDNAAVHFWGAGLNWGVYSYWNMGSGFSFLIPYQLHYFM